MYISKLPLWRNDYAERIIVLFDRVLNFCFVGWDLQ